MATRNEGRERVRCLEILGLSEGASDDDIRKAYKKLALQHHPDKNESNDATETFQEISSAYKYLTEGPSVLGDGREFNGGHGIPFEVLIRMFPWLFPGHAFARSPFGPFGPFGFSHGGPSFYYESDDDDEYYFVNSDDSSDDDGFFFDYRPPTGFEKPPKQTWSKLSKEYKVSQKQAKAKKKKEQKKKKAAERNATGQTSQGPGSAAQSTTRNHYSEDINYSPASDNRRKDNMTSQPGNRSDRRSPVTETFQNTTENIQGKGENSGNQNLAGSRKSSMTSDSGSTRSFADVQENPTVNQEQGTDRSQKKLTKKQKKKMEADQRKRDMEMEEIAANVLKQQQAEKEKQAKMAARKAEAEKAAAELLEKELEAAKLREAEIAAAKLREAEIAAAKLREDEIASAKLREAEIAAAKLREAETAAAKKRNVKSDKAGEASESGKERKTSKMKGKEERVNFGKMPSRTGSNQAPDQQASKPTSNGPQEKARKYLPKTNQTSKTPTSHQPPNNPVNQQFYTTPANNQPPRVPTSHHPQSAPNHQQHPSAPTYRQHPSAPIHHQHPGLFASNCPPGIPTTGLPSQNGAFYFHVDPVGQERKINEEFTGRMTGERNIGGRGKPFTPTHSSRLPSHPNQKPKLNGNHPFMPSEYGHHSQPMSNGFQGPNHLPRGGYSARGTSLGGPWYDNIGQPRVPGFYRDTNDRYDPGECHGGNQRGRGRGGYSDGRGQRGHSRGQHGRGCANENSSNFYPSSTSNRGNGSYNNHDSQRRGKLQASARGRKHNSLSEYEVKLSDDIDSVSLSDHDISNGGQKADYLESSTPSRNNSNSAQINSTSGSVKNEFHNYHNSFVKSGPSFMDELDTLDDFSIGDNIPGDKDGMVNGNASGGSFDIGFSMDGMFSKTSLHVPHHLGGSDHIKQYYSRKS